MAAMPIVEVTITATEDSTVYQLPTPATSMAFIFSFPSLDLRAAERHLIEHALVLTNGNKTKAARLLGLNVRSLRRKLNSKRTTPAPTRTRDPRQISLV